MRNDTPKRLTAKESFSRHPEKYNDFITLKEMEQWQTLCQEDRYSKKYYLKKLEANQLLRCALWKYSRVLDYGGFEHGMYEYFMSALQTESDSLKKIIRDMKKERVEEV